MNQKLPLLSRLLRLPSPAVLSDASAPLHLTHDENVLTILGPIGRLL